MIDEGSRLFDEAVIGRRRMRRWVTIAVAALLLLRLAAEVVPVARRPDLVLLDFWQTLKGTRAPSPQVVIVGIDEKSIARFGPPAWPRSEYVPLVERLAAAGAKVIGFDYTFGELEREADNNRLFAAAIKKAGNVVFGYEFTRVGDPSPPGGPLPEPVRATALARFESVAVPPAPGLIAPEPVLAGAAAAVGHVRAIMGEDGRMRMLPLVVQYGEQGYPSLALQVARVYTGTPAGDVGLAGGVVQMGAWDVPVSPSGEVLLNWPAAGEKAFPQYSFLDVVRGDVPDEAFRGKAVLVAGTADGLDDRDFPFAVEAPGVLAYAIFLDNVFRFDFVQAPVWAWLVEWGLYLALCGLCVWLLPRLPTPALLAPLGLVVALRLTASERKTRDLGAEKLDQERLLGLSFQEKGMLDMALATFNKLPFTPDMKLVYLNLGLDYENRGLREKAFLVYKKIFDADPAFEDVVQRMERLSQAGAGSSFFSAPTGLAGRTATPAPTAAPPTESPLGHLVATDATPTENDVPTQIAPTVRGGVQPTAPGRTAVPPPTHAAPPTVHSTPSPSVTSMPTGPAPPGARLGRYVVERHLGRGGMGDVYLVNDTVIDRKAALKTIRLDTEADPKQTIEIRQRFYREGQTAGRLTHPNIVTVYDVGEDLGMSYIVMEFVEGQTLTQWMKAQRFSVGQIKHVVYNAAMALQYAHENGIYHRDVKPDNIMVGKSGQVKVMDFGIARAVDSTLTKTGSVMGTPAYMSPEQAEGRKIDARSDIFSLGVILYELLTGRKPFRGDTYPSLMFAILKEEPPPPSQVDPNVSPAWDAIVARALAKNRDERYQTAKDFAQAVKDGPGR